MQGKWRYSSTHSYLEHKVGVSGQPQTPAALPAEKEHPVPTEEGLSRPQSRCGCTGDKTYHLPLLGFKPRIVELVA